MRCYHLTTKSVYKDKKLQGYKCIKCGKFLPKIKVFPYLKNKMSLFNRIKIFIYFKFKYL